MMYASGDVFEGQWFNDLKHGPGTYFYINRGKRFDGVWQEGKPDRVPTYVGLLDSLLFLTCAVVWMLTILLTAFG